jgi:hypothetical protein
MRRSPERKERLRLRSSTPAEVFTNRGDAQWHCGCYGRERMKILFPAELSRCFLFVSSSGLLLLTGCSKSDVNVMARPSPESIVVAAAPDHGKSAADRVVEIDRLLAVPLTGTPEESDRRAALRAEREALVASGQVPYQLASQNRPRYVPTPPNNTVTRATNGNVVHYAAPQTRTEAIVVAPNSQSKNLSYVEQMTPTEREHYYKTIKAYNTQRVEVEVHRR